MAIVLITQLIFKPLTLCIKKKYKRDVSLIKMTRYLVKNTCKIEEIVWTLYKNGKNENILNTVCKYCTFDSRKRNSFNEEFEIIYKSSLA